MASTADLVDKFIQSTQKLTATKLPDTVVRKLSAESGIDAASVEGTGKDGRVSKGDMLAAIATGGAAAPAALDLDLGW